MLCSIVHVAEEYELATRLHIPSAAAASSLVGYYWLATFTQGLNQLSALAPHPVLAASWHASPGTRARCASQGPPRQHT